MKFGVTVGNFGTFGKRGGAVDQVLIGQRAELLGFDSVWVHDHLFMPALIRARYPYNESGSAGFAYRQDIYDPLSMMAALAVRTRRVQIGTSVLIVPYRNPLILAKMLATIDQLSQGRVLLGIGVGWMAEEFEALGIGDYYPVRGAVTDEWMRICLEAWTAEGQVSHEGRFQGFRNLKLFPSPVQKPHIPILVGGKGPAAARRAARYGSGYQTITSTPRQLSDELEILRGELEKRGRVLSDIEVSMLGPFISLGGNASELASHFGIPEDAVAAGSKQDIIDRLGEFKRAGLQHAIALPAFADEAQPNPERTMEAMHRMAEDILPALR